MPATHASPPHRLHITAAVIGGFVSAFAASSAAVLVRFGGADQAQLLAGDPTANRQYPTTLNTMIDAQTGINPMVNALQSYGWWLMVLLLTVIFSWILWRMLRKAMGRTEELPQTLNTGM